MLKVYKYPVPIQDYFEIEMPHGSKILTFQMQNGEPYIWVLASVDPEPPMVPVSFRLAGTGHEIEESFDRLNYIGTAQQGAFVWHLFQFGPGVQR